MLLVCTPLFADGTQLGTVSGRVIDQSQSAIPGATVEALNIEKGTTRRTITDADGKYIVPLLHPGTYKVSITLSGFDTFIAQNAVVEVGKTTTINATLKVTTTSETITVLGDVPVVDKTNASDTTTVSTQLAQRLPIGRTYQALALSGPIWRDHAWFFGAYEWDKATSPQRQTLDPKTPQNFISVPRDHFYDLKATWQAAPSKLIVLKANESPTDDIVVDRHNGGINAIPRFAGDLGAMNIQNQGSKSRALQYSGVAMNMLAMEAGVAASKIHIDFRPFVGDTPVHQDLSTGLFYNGPSIVGFLERTRDQADFATNYFRVIHGSTHDFKIGV